jgi:exosortase/archaeosortase family protein
LSSFHNSALHRAAAPSFSLPSRSELAICARLLLCLATILIVYLISPALYNGSALWAMAAPTLLIFRRGQAKTPNPAELTIARLTPVRLVAFAALYVIIAAIGRHSASAFTSAAASDASAAAILAAAKLLILLPGLALFSKRDWIVLLRKYSPEFLAALVVLFTFFPYRLFHTIWPVYSQAIATLAYYAAKPFVTGLGFISHPIPTILGPKINLEIVFWCSGFSALALFDTLVALIAFLDWNELNHKRLFIAYIAGGFAILVANVIRICMLVMVGNLIDPKYATGRFHVNAGWVFFAAIYLAVLSISYRWMLDEPARSSSNSQPPLDKASRPSF